MTKPQALSRLTEFVSDRVWGGFTVFLLRLTVILNKRFAAPNSLPQLQKERGPNVCAQSACTWCLALRVHKSHGRLSKLAGTMAPIPRTPCPDELLLAENSRTAQDHGEVHKAEVLTWRSRGNYTQAILVAINHSYSLKVFK